MVGSKKTGKWNFIFQEGLEIRVAEVLLLLEEGLYSKESATFGTNICILTIKEKYFFPFSYWVLFVQIGLTFTYNDDAFLNYVLSTMYRQLYYLISQYLKLYTVKYVLLVVTVQVTPWHAYWGGGRGIAPTHSKPGARGKWVVSTILRPL